MNTKHILIAALLAAAFAPATAENTSLESDTYAAQGESAPEQAGATRSVVRVVSPDREPVVMHFENLVIDGPSMARHAHPVKNAPYSAQVVSEQQQNLADGNQIVNRTSSMTWRDSAGRTRQEVRDAAGTVRSITIHDAVEGSTYILRPESKTAIKIASRGEIGRLAGEKARERIEQMRKEGDGRVIVKSIERVEGDVKQQVREDVQIRVRQALAGAGAPHAMMGLNRFGPEIAGAFGDMKWSAKATTRDLGSREIEGVKAQGKLRSYEIPAGEIGNRNPIVVSSESWYSPELQVTLLSKRSDPRTGERTYRLESLKREEPAAALFAVPSDYTVRDPLALAKKRKEEAKK